MDLVAGVYENTIKNTIFSKFSWYINYSKVSYAIPLIILYLISPML